MYSCWILKHFKVMTEVCKGIFLNKIWRVLCNRGTSEPGLSLFSCSVSSWDC